MSLTVTPLPVPTPASTARARPPIAAFIAGTEPSLATVRAQVMASTVLPPARRDSLRRSVTRVARLLGLPEEQVPANPRWLAKRLGRLVPRTHGISPKRLANLTSDLKAALAVAGIGRGPRSYLAPLDDAWGALWATLDGPLRWRLSRWMRFCSSQGVAPGAVDDALAQEFLAALRDEGFVDSPEQTWRNAIAAWNKAVSNVPGCPAVRLTLPAIARKGWTLPLTAFPASFQADVDRWLDRLAGADLLADEGPIRPLSPMTLRHRRFQLRLAASALVQRGRPIEAIASLATLVEVEAFKEILRFQLDRFGGQPTEAIHGLATGLKACAAHHVKVAPEHLEQLRRLCKKLDLEAEGPRERNRERLVQFDDPANVALLLALPGQLLDLALERGRSRRRIAVDVQLAVAIELLLLTALRIGDLSSLSLERHLRWARIGGKDALYIHIPPHETKGRRRAIEHELIGSSATLIRHYILQHRPLLTESPCEWLFPGRWGQAKNRQGLSAQIARTIRRHTGLTVNVHLFRSLVGKLHLSRHPGEYTVMTELLGHASTETTRQAYLQFEARSARRHYQEALQRLRDELVGQRERRGAGSRGQQGRIA